MIIIHKVKSMGNGINEYQVGQVEAGQKTKRLATFKVHESAKVNKIIRMAADAVSIKDKLYELIMSDDLFKLLRKL